MKVSFIIAGTQKGGTSALHSFLSQHSNICFAKNKETHFFDNDRLFKKIKDPENIQEKFHSRYSQGPDCSVYGDATPVYMYWKPAMKRIYEYNKDMKLIFVLRNPIERAFSHYRMAVSRKAEKLSFMAAILIEPLRALRSFPLQGRKTAYVGRGYYAGQIKRVLKYFPMQNLLFVKSDELMNNHQETIDRVCEFIGVPPYKVEQEIVFKTSYTDTMTSRQREYLKRKFRKSIHELERLLNWDCSDWLK